MHPVREVSLAFVDRNSMTDERLSDLALFAVEKETVKQVELAAVVDKFDSEHQNRRIRLH